jgi:hypothetical protein
MLGTITISIPMVVILALNDWITPTLAYYLWVSATVASDTISGAVLTWDWHCSSLWLPIDIFHGVVCGCEYLSNFLLLVWIDGWICQICGPN